MIPPVVQQANANMTTSKVIKRLCPYQNSFISTQRGDTRTYLHVHKVLKHSPNEADGLELLNDQLLLCIMGELVGEEQVTVIKCRQAVDVDLPSL